MRTRSGGSAEAPPAANEPSASGPLARLAELSGSPGTHVGQPPGGTARSTTTLTITVSGPGEGAGSAIAAAAAAEAMRASQSIVPEPTLSMTSTTPLDPAVLPKASTHSPPLPPHLAATLESIAKVVAPVAAASPSPGSPASAASAAPVAPVAPTATAANGGPHASVDLYIDVPPSHATGHSSGPAAGGLSGAAVQGLPGIQAAMARAVSQGTSGAAGLAGLSDLHGDFSARAPFGATGSPRTPEVDISIDDISTWSASPRAGVDLPLGPAAEAGAQPVRPGAPTGRFGRSLAAGAAFGLLIAVLVGLLLYWHRLADPTDDSARAIPPVPGSGTEPQRGSGAPSVAGPGREAVQPPPSAWPATPARNTAPGQRAAASGAAGTGTAGTASGAAGARRGAGVDAAADAALEAAERLLAGQAAPGASAAAPARRAAPPARAASQAP